MDREGSVESEEDTLPEMANLGRGLGGGRRNTLLLGQRKSIVPSSLSVPRPSVWTLGRKSKAQDVKLENTYRMGPKEEERMLFWRLRPVLHDAMRDCLIVYVYNSATAGEKVREMSQVIRDRLKDAGYLRYKMVVQVHLLQRRQDLCVTVGSRAVWSVECGDTCVEVQFSNKTLRALAILHAFYFE